MQFLRRELSTGAHHKQLTQVQTLHPQLQHRLTITTRQQVAAAPRPVQRAARQALGTTEMRLAAHALRHRGRLTGEARLCLPWIAHVLPSHYKPQTIRLALPERL